MKSGHQLLPRLLRWPGRLLMESRDFADPPRGGGAFVGEVLVDRYCQRHVSASALKTLSGDVQGARLAQSSRS
jgi:hypothetical protein